MRRSSISLRLIAGASLWIAAALVFTGILLTGLFRNHVTRAFDIELRDHAQELLALTDVDEDGIYLKRHPADPRFKKPLSGWYWQVDIAAKPPERSRSLWDQDIPEARPSPVVSKVYVANGPHNQLLRVYRDIFSLPGSPHDFTIRVAGPVSNVDSSVRIFAVYVVFSLTVLGIGLVGAVILQVFYGLLPLRRVSQVLADIRAGRAARLEETFAIEIEPLAQELNAFLDHEKAVVERARTEAGNLAHALKTPLTVIRNEAGGIEGEAGEMISQQAEAMTRHVDHYLSHARAAGSRDVLGARTSVEPVIEGLSRTLHHIFAERGLVIDIQGTEGLYFRGEREDLEEMLGNLMENGCKWARHQVNVRGLRVGTELRLAVSDDGPGIPEKFRADVLGRGQRLDESKPGSGLGLPIVRDIAELYGGTLVLEQAPSGGLSAILSLPAI